MGVSWSGGGAGLSIAALATILLMVSPAIPAEAAPATHWEVHGEGGGTGYWSGEVTVSGTETVGPEATLHVAPGTLVRPGGPDARLVVNGSLHAVGAPTRPVVVGVPLSVGGAGDAELAFALLRPHAGTALRVGPAAGLSLRDSVVEGAPDGVVIEDDPDLETDGESASVERTVFRGTGGTGTGLHLHASTGDHAPAGETGEAGDGERAYHEMVEVTGNRLVDHGVGLAVTGWGPHGLRLVGNHLEGNDVGVRVVDGDATLYEATFRGNDVDAEVGPGSGLRVPGDGREAMDLRAAAGASAEAGDVVVREHPQTTAAKFAAIAGIVLVSLHGFLDHLTPRALLARLRYRTDEEELLENETRQRILDLLQEEPGMHARELGRHLDGYKHTAYHANKLADAGILRTRRDGVYLRYYPVDLPSEESPRGIRARLLDLVRGEPGIEQARAARKLDCSRQLASYHAQNLEDDDRIRRERERGDTRLYPADG